MPTGEREPELFWTDMSDSEWSAQNAPWSPAWVATLARNTECHKRALYGLGSYLGDVPHDHQTGETAHMSPAVGVNVVQASCPALTVDPGEIEGERENVWAASGFSIQVLKNIWFATYGEDRRAAEGGAAGGYLTQRLYALGGGRQSAMFGSGTDMVLAVFVRAQGTLSRGSAQFGLSGGREGKAIVDAETDYQIEGPGEFGFRSSGVIHYTDLSTTWARFYVRVNTARSGIAGDVRLTVSVAQGFDEKIEITGFTASHGRRLYPWAPSPGDLPQTPYSFGHAGWNNMPRDVPLLDWAISMDNAIKMEPI